MLPRDLEVQICLRYIVQLLRSQLRSHRITMRVPDSRVTEAIQGLIQGSLNPGLEILDLQLDNPDWALKSAASSPFTGHVISCFYDAHVVPILVPVCGTEDNREGERRKGITSRGGEIKVLPS
jgi:hypothetical protein